MILLLFLGIHNRQTQHRSSMGIRAVRSLASQDLEMMDEDDIVAHEESGGVCVLATLEFSYFKDVTVTHTFHNSHCENGRVVQMAR